ncbi:MAG: hypothetical protein AAF851_05805 [Myxococcota bacterium]
MSDYEPGDLVEITRTGHIMADTLGLARPGDRFFVLHTTSNGDLALAKANGGPVDLWAPPSSVKAVKR